MFRFQKKIVAGMFMLLVISACTSEQQLTIEAPVASPSAKTTPARTYRQEDVQGKTVKLGFHYRPLKNKDSAETLAEEASFVILTKTDEEYRDKLRAAGYKGLILQYIRGSEAEGPPTKTGASKCAPSQKPWPNQVADQPEDFCDLIHPHEDWFLHNSEGERLYSGDRRFYHMNPGSKGWRDFVTQRLRKSMFGDGENPPLGYDGIFLDNVELSLLKDEKLLDNSDGTVKEYATDEEFRAAWVGWLRHIKDELGPSVPVWANMIGGRETGDDWNDYLPYLDGTMEEAFVTGYSGSLSTEKQNKMLAQAEHVIKQGKGFYAVSQGKEADEKRQKFALAAFLLVMEPDVPTYFRYTFANAGYGQWWYFDNFDIELGAPLGTRYKVKNGWRRDFERGYVELDQVKRIGKIVRRS